MKFSKLILSLVCSCNFITASALASVTCVMQKIVGNQDSLLCSSTTIPNNGLLSANFQCNGSVVTVDCNLHNKPNQLSLKIVGPDGITASTPTGGTSLRLADKEGNGASVLCTSEASDISAQLIPQTNSSQDAFMSNQVSVKRVYNDDGSASIFIDEDNSHEYPFLWRRFIAPEIPRQNGDIVKSAESKDHVISLECTSVKATSKNLCRLDLKPGKNVAIDRKKDCIAAVINNSIISRNFNVLNGPYVSEDEGVLGALELIPVFGVGQVYLSSPYVGSAGNNTNDRCDL